MRIITSRKDRRWLGLDPGEENLKVVELPRDVVASAVLLWLTEYAFPHPRPAGWFIAWQLAAAIQDEGDNERA